MVYCRDDAPVKREYMEAITVARQRLAPFNTLKDIFNNFQSYQAEQYELNKNIVFCMCRRFSNENAQRLYKLETALFIFKNQWASNEYTEFIERLTSKERFKSYAAFTEIVTAFEIGEKIGFHNVNLHYKVTTKKKPDIFFKLNNNKGIFLELTALDIGKTEEKIEIVLNDLEKYIVHKCQKRNYYVLIYFDTSDLIHDEKGNIDEEYSKIFLHRQVDRLFLSDLAGYNAKIEFNHPFLDTLDNIEYVSDLACHPFLPVNLSNIISDKGILGLWAKKVRMRDFYNSPFVAVSFFERDDNGCAEIQRREFDSSDPSLKGHELLRTSEAVRPAFLNHINRALTEKVRCEQYEKGKPTIIGIRAKNWRYILEDYDDFVKLRDSVQSQLSKYNEISGVILYNDQLYYGRYIENCLANQETTRVPAVELEDAGIIHKYISPY
jgi:hypothetical protein